MGQDEINFSGNFQGAIINYKSVLTNVSQTTGQIPWIETRDREELKGLIEALNAALEELPDDRADERVAVAQQAKTLVDTANAKTPNKSLLQVAVKGLQDVAKIVADKAPTVLSVANQIADLFSKFGN